MLSPYELETLGDLIKEIRDLNLCAKRYDRFLENLSEKLSGNQNVQENSDRFTDSEVERLMTLNRRLGEIESLIHDTAQELRPGLIDKINNPENPMGDFEIDTKTWFILRDDDPEAREDSDNILTTRDDSISYPETVDEDLVDFRESHDSTTAQLAAEPHCYLFHDLYDHRHGVEQPNVPLPDCLRIGTVWIDVIIRQQYYLDIETGKWDKSCGNEKLAELARRPPYDGRLYSDLLFNSEVIDTWGKETTGADCFLGTRFRPDVSHREVVVQVRLKDAAFRKSHSEDTALVVVCEHPYQLETSLNIPEEIWDPLVRWIVLNQAPLTRCWVDESYTTSELIKDFRRP